MRCRLINCIWCAALSFCCVAPFGASARAAETVALELVLAIDTSASVDVEEFELQFTGLADAFRDPGVLDAIASAQPLGIAATVMQWAGPHSQEVTVPWRHIRTPREAFAFADEIAATQRVFLIDVTAIGEAIDFATDLIAANGFVAPRRVIDVSGDGQSNFGILPSIARDRAVRDGITINGLVILNDQQHVYQHYRDEVVGGIASFIQTANRFRDYATAIRNKLIQEIQAPPTALAPSETNAIVISPAGGLTRGR
jgi:hypothetical protein